MRNLVTAVSFQCRGPISETGNDVAAVIEYYDDGSRELYCSQLRKHTVDFEKGTRIHSCRYRMANSDDACPYMGPKLILPDSY